MDYTCPQKGKVSMPKEQRTFSKEFKLEAVALAQSSGGLAPCAHDMRNEMEL